MNEGYESKLEIKMEIRFLESPACDTSLKYPLNVDSVNNDQFIPRNNGDCVNMHYVCWYMIHALGFLKRISYSKSAQCSRQICKFDIDTGIKVSCE